MTKKLFLNKINIQNDIGIVGGGKFEKILEQTAGVKLFSKIYFLIYICEITTFLNLTLFIATIILT